MCSPWRWQTRLLKGWGGQRVAIEWCNDVFTDDTRPGSDGVTFFSTKEVLKYVRVKHPGSPFRGVQVVKLFWWIQNHVNENTWTAMTKYWRHPPNITATDLAPPLCPWSLHQNHAQNPVRRVPRQIVRVFSPLLHLDWSSKSLVAAALFGVFQRPSVWGMKLRCGFGDLQLCLWLCSFLFGGSGNSKLNCKYKEGRYPLMSKTHWNWRRLMEVVPILSRDCHRRRMVWSHPTAIAISLAVAEQWRQDDEFHFHSSLSSNSVTEKRERKKDSTENKTVSSWDAVDPLPYALCSFAFMGQVTFPRPWTFFRTPIRIWFTSFFLVKWSWRHFQDRLFSM